MNARLDDATADRLAKILGLLGSDHAGERAAAAAKANALVREAGLTWRDVLMPSPPIARSWKVALIGGVWPLSVIGKKLS